MYTRIFPYAACIMIVSMCLVACGGPAGTTWDEDIPAMPWLADKLEVASDPTPPPRGTQELDLHGLHIGLPAGITGSVIERHVEGETKSRESVQITGDGNRTLNISSVAGFVQDSYDLGESPEVKKWCRDFAQFRKGFTSDLDLIQAAHRAVPNDVKVAANKADRDKLRVLLMVKNSLLVPATEVRLPKITIFYGKETPSALFAEIFDSSGKCRGGLIFKASDGKLRQDDSDLLVKVLYYAYFERSAV